MRKDRQSRIVSLILASLLIAGGYLFLEYGQQTSAHLTSKALAPTLTPQHAPAPKDHHSTTRSIFKCEKNGRLRYGDQPCAPGETLLSASPNPSPPPFNEGARLARMRETANDLENARLNREKQYAKSTAANLVQINAQATKTERCLSIDGEIKSLDGLLREPHSATEGDRLTSHRRKLTDERFSIGC